MKSINPDTVSKPNGPYVHGLRVPAGSDLLFVSGQVAVRTDGSIPSSFKEQTELVFFNITEILKHEGLKPSNIVKLMSFVTDQRFLPEFGPIRAQFLQDHRPTSTLLVVPALAKPEFLVEVEAIATFGA
jgi:2-iminobutanoate/2-iminopropanoate deaminase